MEENEHTVMVLELSPNLMVPVCVTPSGSTGPSGSLQGGNRPHRIGTEL